MQNLLDGPPETLLPVDSGAHALGAGAHERDVAAAHPDSVLAWAMLAEEALASGETIEGYAFARTAYHRSLDALRRGGWRGQGPVPWSHEPNRGFLRSLAALATASEALGDAAEADRCRTFLRDSSAEGAEALLG